VHCAVVPLPGFLPRLREFRFVSTVRVQVCPGQYEVAPLFGEANVSVDQNVLVMDVLTRVSRKHGLKVRHGRRRRRAARVWRVTCSV
jgi:hypothetical protein